MTAKKNRKHYKNQQTNKTKEELKHERAKKAAVGATSVILGAGILAGTNTRPVKASARREENTELIATANNEEKELDLQVNPETQQPVVTQSESSTSRKSYEDSKKEVEDINNSVNDDLKQKVDEASKEDGVTVVEKDPNTVNTTVNGIKDNADKIKDNNQQQIEEINATLKKHQEALAKYEKESAEYQAAKEAYLAELKELGLWDENKHVDPSTLSQLLQLGKETNATVKAEGLNQNVVQGSDSILSGLLDNFWEVKGDIAGDFLKVTYDNLENSSYNGKKIGKIEVTYSDFVLSNNSYQSAKNPAGIYFGNNPTDGFFYRKADGVTMDIKMYDEDGNLITLGDNTAYITIGSLNNGSSSTGHPEYVEKAEIINGDGQHGQGIALPESSITVHDGNVLYSEKDNELIYKNEISNTDLAAAIGIWGKDIVDKYLGWDDSVDRSKEIFGAGLFQVSGNGIKIRFSNELGSAWATFSTTIPKMTFDQEAPEKPTATITWQPGQLVLNKNSNVHIHYIDVHDKAMEGLTSFVPEHGTELVEQLQSHTHLAIGDLYENQLWDWKAANYILATETHDPDAEKGTVLEDDKHVYVYLKRATDEVQRKKIVNQVIHYVYEDGSQAADDYHGIQLEFIQKGIKNHETGETDWNGEWTSAQTFVTVVSPIIPGYTADRKEVGPYLIEVNNANADEDLDKKDIVVYVKDAEPTTPTDQPTDPSNPTNPTTPEQPTVPEDNPTTPEQPTVPEDNPTTPPVLPEDPNEPLDPGFTVDTEETTVHQESDKNVTPKPETMANRVSNKKQNVTQKTSVKQDADDKLPETGAEEERAGWLAAIAAALGLTGLLGARKFKEDEED